LLIICITSRYHTQKSDDLIVVFKIEKLGIGVESLAEVETISHRQQVIMGVVAVLVDVVGHEPRVAFGHGRSLPSSGCRGGRRSVRARVEAALERDDGRDIRVRVLRNEKLDHPDHVVARSQAWKAGGEKRHFKNVSIELQVCRNIIFFLQFLVFVRELDVEIINSFLLECTRDNKLQNLG
jgi:hypothetical protein